MIKVNNRKAVATLSRRTLSANRARNIIAVLAIAITACLFTSLFTIAGTIISSSEQVTFRQVGGDMHGTFKSITDEQVRELSSDPLIVKPAARLMLGMSNEPPLHKVHVEISYMDEICAKGYFCMPEYGSLPQEGTDQIACDTRILKLLGVEPVIGAKITLPYTVGQNTGNPMQFTGTFTLSGWWKHDPVSVASHAIVPRSYAEKILAEYSDVHTDTVNNLWDLNVYLKSLSHIETDLKQILANHGYQTDDIQADNYIDIGVNWAYTGAQLSANFDLGTMAAMAVLLVVIVFTGYLIIYNIFRISVANDIRFYGLLKTIGTTGQQIRRIIRRQSFVLSAVGIPIGLILGYLLGNILSPGIISSMTTIENIRTSANPLIFVGAAAFSLLTILISCRKPAKIAGKVSPVEAVRYTESTGIKKTAKKSMSGGKVSRMAFANLGRSKMKTTLVVLSLSLAVLLLQITYSFTVGFDMDKYLQKFFVSDFIVGHADYFQTGRGGETGAVPEEVINAISAENGITEAGRIYGSPFINQTFTPEEYYRQRYLGWKSEERLNLELSHAERSSDGLVAGSLDLYGMEALPLDKLTVIEGDLAPLYDPSQNAIAAVYFTDDYDKPQKDSNWVKVGDKVTVRYVDSWQDYESYDMRTGEAVTAEEVDENNSEYINMRPVKYRDVTYTVAACVVVPNTMSFRFYGREQFILNSDVFKRDTGKSDIINYLLDVDENSVTKMEEFLAYYTENVDPTMDYESKQSYVNEFKGFQNMFLLLGSTLSGVIGLVGILNFFNAVLTSILTRKREFAMLQSIGMTSRQLNGMLICEGVFYAVFAVMFSMIASLVTGPMFAAALSNMFWFFTYRFTVLPVVILTPVFLLLGIVLPLATYRFTSRQTIVERLREVE